MHVMQQGETTAALRRIPFRLIAMADDSAMTGETPTVAIRKNYGASAAGEGTVTELAGGLYYYEATADELDTLGTLTIIPAAEGAYSIAYDVAVVEFAPTEAGIDAPENFDALVISESGVVDGNVVQISGDSGAADNLEAAADGTGYNLGGGSVVVASVTGAVGSVTGNVGGNVAGSVGSVTTVSDKTGYALTSGERTAIGTAVWASSTRTLSSFGSLVSDIATAVWGATSRTLSAISDSAGITTLLSRLSSERASALGYLDAPVSTRATSSDVSSTEAAIISHGDGNWTGEGSGGDSAEAIAEAVRSELATELGRLDAAVSTRLAASGYTAPDNAGITAIGTATATILGDAAAARTAAESADGKLTTPRLAELDKDLVATGDLSGLSTFDPANDSVQLDTTQEIIEGVTLGDLLLGKVSILTDGEGGISVVDADGTQLFAGTYEVKEDGTVSMEVAP
jgi:hypothetical protein